MGTTVYADLYFLINFSMDFLCFFLSAKILNRKFYLGRGLLGAFVGGLYSVCSLFLQLFWLWMLLLDVGVCALMCLTVFYRRGHKSSLLVCTLVYIAISMALGGVMTALFSLLNRVSPSLGESMEGDGLSVWGFALLALISALLTGFGGRFFAGKSGQRRAALTVDFRGKRVCLRAMTDSGNLLREPISGRPCVVADWNAMASMLPARLLQAAKRGDVGGMEEIGQEYGRAIRIIPTNTASGHGMLLAIRPDRLIVQTEKGTVELDALVALADLGGRAGGNEALLPSEVTVSC